LWSDYWTHKITKLVLSSNDSGTKFDATVNTKYDQNFTISAPASSISLTTLKSYIDEAVQNSGVSERSQTAQAESNAGSAQAIAEVIFAETGHYPSTVSEFST